LFISCGCFSLSIADCLLNIACFSFCRTVGVPAVYGAHQAGMVSRNQLPGKGMETFLGGGGEKTKEKQKAGQPVRHIVYWFTSLKNRP
jgi:hypothetical protein